MATAAPVGQGFNLNPSDLKFILAQIKISEQHAATATAANPCGTLLGTGPNQIPNANGGGVLLPFGLRTVDGTCNNLLEGNSGFASIDKTFPRIAPPVFSSAQTGDPDGPGPAPAVATSYTQKSGLVFDSEPRMISNTIVDQTATNPAAVATAGEGAVPTASGAFEIPNVAPDVGLSAPYNSWFTLFGQFFDHGLDLTSKGRAGTVFMPLAQDDPLYDAGPDNVPGTADDSPTNFMVLTRATNQPGPDNVLGTTDDVQEATNQTSSFIDQSQTYTSHPSHQVFLREYANNAAGDPVSTGKLITGPGGDGMANWAGVKAQAATMLGIALSDQDVASVPMLATDAYGKFTPGVNGYPQLVMADNTLVEGDPAAPVSTTGARKSGRSFLDDIAHHAAPGLVDHDRNPRTAKIQAVADTDPGTADDNDPATFDDEMLGAHFIAGDGRLNENIGLTAVHHVFHSEHNRLTGDIQSVLATEDAASLPEWQLADGSWNGERLFQAARFVTEMEYQHLAFEEFARKVQPQVNLFGGYDATINPAIKAEFAHSVYRFGHSMLNETVDRTSPDGTTRNIDLLGAFLNPPEFKAGGLTSDQAAGDIVRGMTNQRGNELDEFVTEALRNRLLGLPLDLAALNLARGRDTGIQPLNGARRAFFEAAGDAALAPYANWNDFGLALRHPESLANFVAAYGTHETITGSIGNRRLAAAALIAANPDPAISPADSIAFMEGTGAYRSADGVNTSGLEDVDLWVGGLAEKQQPFGGLLGNTFNYVFETQMENLQDGDRLYYLPRTAGLNLLVQLEGNSFAELIQRNSDVEGLPADSFSRPDLRFNLAAQNATGPIVDDPATPYNEMTLLIRMADNTIRFNGPEHVVFNGTPGDDRMWSSEGDDTLRGNDGDDRLEGAAGNDTLIGGLGRDILTDTFGNDVTKGGDGNDAISSGQGFDLNQPGRGHDFVIGGSDPTETFGGEGNDMIFAGASTDTVFGDNGDDWIEGGGQNDLLQGDNGAPFQDDPNVPGHDVIDGDGGNDDYDSEGGDDIMVAGPGIERSEGMLGFDWSTHKGDPVAANSDLLLTGLLPPTLETNRDRFDLVEGLSGWNLADTLRGDESVATTLVGHELNAAGIARINGLAGLLPAGATSFSAGNIIIGGAGSDLIEGRGGDDTIDGDAWLNVRLSVVDANGVQTQSAESMAAVRAGIFAGTIDPGQVRIVREILTGTDGIDTAMFSGNRDEYTITGTGTSLSVAHTGGLTVDGTDTVRNVEQLRFLDQTVVMAPGVPTGVSATAGIASATVRWTAPADPGATAITSYEVQVLTGTTVVDTITGIPASATSRVVTGLTDGTPYTFQVRAVNASGAGALSLASNEVTPMADTVAPTVTASTPADLATGVPVPSNVTATFSEDVVGVSATSFTLADTATGTLVPSAVTYDGATRVATIDPNAGLGVGVQFTVTLTGGTGAIVDASGNPLATRTWTFTTTDVVPTVTARTPAADATGVPVANNVTATFSEAVTGVNGTNVTLRNAATNATIAAAVTYNATTRVATLNPNANLAADIRYTVTLSSGITNALGTPLAATTWSFLTGPAPTVTNRSPGVNATAVNRTRNITARFSEPVIGVSGTTVTLRVGTTATGALVPAAVSYDAVNRVATLNPTGTLPANTQFTVRLTSEITDRAGNPLTAVTWSFRTGA